MRGTGFWWRMGKRWVSQVDKFRIIVDSSCDSLLLMEHVPFVLEKRMTKFLGDVFIWHILIVILFKITELNAGVENVKAEQDR